MNAILLWMTLNTVDKGEHVVKMRFDSVVGCEFFSEEFNKNRSVTGYIKHSCFEELK